MSSILRYGLLAGVLLFLPLFGPYFVFGARPEWMKLGEVVGYTAMLLCLSATWFAMRRERERRGAIRYGAALSIGVGVSLVAGVVFGLATWGFFIAAGDALPEALFEYYAMQVRESGAAPATIAEQLAELERMKPMLHNRPLQGAVMGATVFLIGLVESLLGAWLVSRRGAVAAPAG